MKKTSKNWKSRVKNLAMTVALALTLMLSIIPEAKAVILNNGDHHNCDDVVSYTIKNRDLNNQGKYQVQRDQMPLVQLTLPKGSSVTQGGNYSEVEVKNLANPQLEFTCKHIEMD